MRSHELTTNEIMPFIAILLWMILDLLRLSWFCIKSVKKVEAKQLIDEDDP